MGASLIALDSAGSSAIFFMPAWRALRTRLTGRPPGFGTGPERVLTAREGCPAGGVGMAWEWPGQRVQLHILN